MTKKAAVAKYAPMLAEGKSEDDIKALLYEEKYSIDDVSEIWEAISSGKVDGENPPLPPMPRGVNATDTPAPAAPVTKNKVYAEHKVTPEYEDILDGMGKKLGRKLTGFNKDSDKPIRTTSISPDKAEILNQQSENTLLRLYEVA